MPRTIRIMVAGSVRNRCASARTLIRTNSRGRSKAGRMISCRFGLKRPIRAEGLRTGTGRLTLRGFLIGHKSMLESSVLVNTAAGWRVRTIGLQRQSCLSEVRMSSPAQRSKAPQSSAAGVHVKHFHDHLHEGKN